MLLPIWLINIWRAIIKYMIEACAIAPANGLPVNKASRVGFDRMLVTSAYILMAVHV